MEIKVPVEIYYLVGAIVITNLGTIMSIMYAALKSAWWLSKLDSRVTAAKEYAIRAHKRIDEHIAEYHE